MNSSAAGRDWGSTSNLQGCHGRTAARCWDFTSHIFASAEGRTHLLSLTGFKEHLADPVELAADTLVSFAIFPAPIARTLFDRTRGDAAGKGLPDKAFARVLEYIANRYSFRFDLIGTADKNLQALAALVHYTKLRRALLDEYQA